MVDEITADSSTLLRQASMTADVYLRRADQYIDRLFGNGFARANPELVAAFMQAAAIDLGSAIVARAIQNGFSELAGAVADAFPLK